MKDMHYKLYNPGPKEFNLKVKLGDVDSNIIIAAGKIAVVSEAVGKFVNTHYAHIEVGSATLEEYQEYRAEREQELKEKEEQARTAAEAAQVAAQEEAERVATKLAAQEVSKQEAAAAAEEHVKNMIAQEQATIATLTEQSGQKQLEVEPATKDSTVNL